MSDELVRLDLAWGAVTRLQADLDAAVAEHIRVWNDTRDAVNKYATDNAHLTARVEELEGALAKMQRSRDRYRQAWEAEKVASAAITNGESK